MVGLLSHAFADPEFPAGRARRDPRRRCVRFDPAIPAVTLGVVEPGKVQTAQFPRRGVDQPAEQNRQMLACLNVGRSPIGNLPSLDGEKVRHI